MQSGALRVGTIFIIAGRAVSILGDLRAAF